MNLDVSHIDMTVYAFGVSVLIIICVLWNKGNTLLYAVFSDSDVAQMNYKWVTMSAPDNAFTW